MDRYGIRQVADVVLDGTRARGVRLLDGTVIEAGWVVLSAGTYGTPPDPVALGHRTGRAPTVGRRPGPSGSAGGRRQPRRPCRGGLDCGYRTPTRTAPILHLVATFHSASSASGQAPDLLLWLSDPRGPAGGPAVFEIDVVLLKPRSRGSVRLRSLDPTEPPLIDLPSLRDPSDVQRLAEGYHRGLEVASHPEIQRLCADPLPPPPRDADELRGSSRAAGYPLPPGVVACSMGTRPEDGAVVDPSGCVHGTQRLSVVDASIMPDAPSGFTHLPTIMIAERLADQIASQR